MSRPTSSWPCGGTATATGIRRSASSNAIGAPTRTLSIVLGIMGYVVLVAFGVGVWRSAAGRRSLRVAGGALMAMGVLSWFGVPLVPMHVRGAEQSLTD